VVRVDAQKAENTALIRRIVLESLYYEMTARQELGAHIKKKLKKQA